MMRKLVGPFGSNYSCEPVLNNLSFAHLDTVISAQSFLAALNCSSSISPNGKNEQNEIVKALSTFSVQLRFGLCLDLGCVFWGQCPVGRLILCSRFYSTIPFKSSAVILFLNLPLLCLSVNYFTYSKHNNSKLLYSLPPSMRNAHYLPILNHPKNSTVTKLQDVNLK